MSKTHLVLVIIILSIPVGLFADNTSKAIRLYNRLAGVPPTEAQVARMVSLLDQGKPEEAARIATDQSTAPGFYNITVKHFASSLTNRPEVQNVPFNDMMASFVGIARDERDARELLYENFSYVGDATKLPAGFLAPSPNPTSNNHYAELETKNLNLVNVLKRVESQASMPANASAADTAGVLTSRAWAESHLIAGTNRRATEFAIREFLCKPLKDLADGTINDDHVRRDVDRSPGGEANVYQGTCRTCHAGLDALAGAWAFFEFGGRIIFTPGQVQQKMTKNGDTYPDGYIPTDASWINRFTTHQNASLGWQGAMSGVGVKDFGRMLANSRQFSVCMAQRAFQTVCFRSASDDENIFINQLADNFINTNYNLRKLFEKTAVLPVCLGN